MNRNGIWAPKSPAHRGAASSRSGLGWAGLGAERSHGQGRFQASAGTGKCFPTALVERIWSVSPQALTEVELLAKSNWMLT